MEKVLLSIIGSLAGLIIALCVYIWTRKVDDYDSMIASLYAKADESMKRHAEHEHRLSVLEGEHAVNSCKARRTKK